MKFIENYNWSITIGLVLLLIGIIIAGACFISWYGKLQARLASEFTMVYTKIQKVLACNVCEQNFDWLNRLFVRLDKCKYQNPEMREVLDNEFKEKYNDIITKRRVEDWL